MKLPFTGDQIPPLDSFSDTLAAFRVKKAELHAEISKKKAQCAVIRARINAGAADPGNARQIRAQQLLGETA